MIHALFAEIANNGLLISGILGFAALSFIALFFLNRTKENVRKKLLWIYLHLVFLFAPLLFVVFYWTCKTILLNCLQKALLWTVPASVPITFLGGFFVVPYIYRKMHAAKVVRSKEIAAFIRKYSSFLSLKKAPKVYYLDTAKPIAHTFTNLIPGIFISVGMFESLNRKELEAVLLHELYHIRSRSSFLKFSTLFVRMFSPIARFSVTYKELSDEEQNADQFAVRMQKTKKFLKSAKKKLEEFK